MYTDPAGYLFGVDDALVAGFGFIVGYVSYGISTGDWGKDALVSGGISAGSSWLIYNTAGAASGFLMDAGMSKGAATIIGNGIGGSVGTITGNVAAQKYFSGSVDWEQARQSALYGFGFGVGSGLVDNSSLMEKQFFMHHTAKYMLRSTVGEFSGNILSNGYAPMTFGLNPGIAFPFLSDVASFTSPKWSSRYAQKKFNSVIEEANDGEVSIKSDIQLQSKIDYGYYTEDSGYWIAGTNEGNYIFNEVGVSARLKILSGGFTIDKVGPITPNGLIFNNLAGFAVDIPLYKLPFNHMSAIHFANAYAMSFRLWKFRF